MTFAPSSPEKLRVDVWSGVACPWCYIGKRRFEVALRQFSHRNQVEVTWHSFELDPNAPESDERSSVEMLASKYGGTHAQAQGMIDNVIRAAAAEGLEYDYSRLKLGNTFRAHQVIHFANSRGRGAVMKERLLRAYFTEGEDVTDYRTLVHLAVEIGLDGAEATAALASGAFAGAVRNDEAQARALGINGVPFFVLGGKYGVSGAQSPAVFLQALDQVWAETHPEPLRLIGGAEGAENCSDESCALPSD
jgi:predicted DsbA family dithiol-disulfide isomerase